MTKTSRRALDESGHPVEFDGADKPTVKGLDSRRLFPDGSLYRVEISSVENPDALRIMVGAAEDYGIRVSRASQGSGIRMLSDDDIAQMVQLSDDHNLELALWAGSRAGWAGGSLKMSGARSASVQGSQALGASIEEVHRACELGVRCVLIADIGLMARIADARQRLLLPSDLKIKTSASFPATNAATARVLGNLGVDSINLTADISVLDMVDIRNEIDVPLDVYVEAPDDLGGATRQHEAHEIVLAASPVYLKFAVRNGPLVYPAGLHLQVALENLVVERVRRASLVVEDLKRRGCSALPPATVVNRALKPSSITSTSRASI